MTFSNRILWTVLLLAALVLGAVGYFWTNSSGTVTLGSLRVLENGFVVDFSPVHSSRARGRVTFRPASDSVAVRVQLENLRPEAQYNVHLHEGSCSRGGAGGVGLKPVRSNGEGVGESQKVLPYERLNSDRDHMVMVHRPDQHHALCADAPSVAQLKSFNDY